MKDCRLTNILLFTELFTILRDRGMQDFLKNTFISDELHYCQSMADVNRIFRTYLCVRETIEVNFEIKYAVINSDVQ